METGEAGERELRGSRSDRDRIPFDMQRGRNLTAHPSGGGSLRGGNGDLHRGNAADRLRLSGFNRVRSETELDVPTFPS